MKNVLCLALLCVIAALTGCTTINITYPNSGQEDGDVSRPDMLGQNSKPDMLDTSADQGCKHGLKVNINAWANRGAVPGAKDVGLLSGTISTPLCQDLGNIPFEITMLGFSIARTDIVEGQPASDLDYCASSPCIPEDAFFVNARVTDFSTGTTIMGPVTVVQTWNNHASIVFTDSFVMSPGQTLTFELRVDISDKALPAVGLRYVTFFDGASVKDPPSDFYIDVGKGQDPGSNRLVLVL